MPLLIAQPSHGSLSSPRLLKNQKKRYEEPLSAPVSPPQCRRALPVDPRIRRRARWADLVVVAPCVLLLLSKGKLTYHQADLNDPESVEKAAALWTAAWGTYALVGGFGLVGAACAFRPFVVLYGYAAIVSCLFITASVHLTQPQQLVWLFQTGVGIYTLYRLFHVQELTIYEW